MDDCIYINGPINVVRLINYETKKVLYTFFDHHLKPSDQTMCDTIKNEDIGSFLVKTLNNIKHNSDKMYDFMFEISPVLQINRKNMSRGRYIDVLERIFQKAFILDTSNNKVALSKELPNLRFHWVEIREILLRLTINLSIYSVPQVVYNLNNNLSTQNLHQYVDLINLINSHLINLYNLLYDTNNNTGPISGKLKFTTEQIILADYSSREYATLSDKIIYKLLNSYNNKSIQKTILFLINGELHEMFIKHFSFIKYSLLKLNKIINKIDILEKTHSNIFDILLLHRDGKYRYGLDDNELKECIELFTNIEDEIFEFIIGGMGLYLMDLFMLRRFLDKPYITNAISYTGQNHSLNYIRLLVKYFNYDITNYSYIKDDNIPSAIIEINKSKTLNELKVIFCPPTRIQCSKLCNFPKLFE